MDSSTLEKLGFDLYGVLAIEPSSTLNEIKTAYRKKALQCHPDKNPDNADAAEEFNKLTKILEILTDETSRKAYDKILRGRQEAALRHQELDSKRKKFKEDLESRERHAQGYKQAKTSEQALQEEIERLREEGAKLLEEEAEAMTKKMREKDDQAGCSDGSNYRLRLKWKADKNDESNGGYTREFLMRCLSKYGAITALVFSSKKKGRAMVEFEKRTDAEFAMQMESGIRTNPLKLEWVNKPA